MSRLRLLPNRLRTIDTRVAQPPPKRADAELQTAAHRRWRFIVCERAGWRCEAIDEATGQRCTRSRANGDTMIADHEVERADGGALLDPANGRCKCVQHNTIKGVQARAARR